MNQFTIDLLRSLRSTLCPACGQEKKRFTSMCSECYKCLPLSPLRNAIYSRIGEGLEEAMVAAFDALGVNNPIFPPEEAADA